MEFAFGKNPYTTFPNWLNLKQRKSRFPNSKNTPWIDYPSVAFVEPQLEQEPQEING